MNEISYSCQLEGDGCEKYQENVQEKVKSTEKKYLWSKPQLTHPLNPQPPASMPNKTYRLRFKGL